MVNRDEKLAHIFSQLLKLGDSNLDWALSEVQKIIDKQSMDAWDAETDEGFKPPLSLTN
ncbi:hypothetical protein HYS94_02060 [Candidatus Daviesbacteria bacterium]|nr:hypothetical protein [Candidatus Daviesbacteria bacterium]